MASQVQIPFEGVILQEHSAPISCPTPNFAKGSVESKLVLNNNNRNIRRILKVVSELALITDVPKIVDQKQYLPICLSIRCNICTYFVNYFAYTCGVFYKFNLNG